MTSRQRLLTALRGGMPDRVPVTMYEHSPLNSLWGNREPSYAPLIALEAEFGDTFVWPEYPLPGLLGPPTGIVRETSTLADGTIESVTRVDTPKGPLRAVDRRRLDVMTSWKVEPLVKEAADVDRLLAIPRPSMPDLSAELTDLQQRVGEAGVICFNIGDAIGRVVDVFCYEDFVRRCVRDDGPVRALLEKAQAILLDAVAALGAHVTDAVFRLWGPEYCGAPLMNPRKFFPPYVVAPDRELTAAIHATGNLSVIHCHGKLRDLLDPIADIAADALEPLETLPLATADVTLAEVKARLGNQMCLMGGIQALTLETAEPDALRAEVRQALAQGAPGGGFVLLPTSAPFKVPLPERSLRNAEIMYHVAHAEGHYP